MNEHRIWHLPENISTDDLAPGHAMKFGLDVIARHCLENRVPDFAREVQRGDVIVAGKNFGMGSSREQAALVLVAIGIKAVMAPSYNGLFFRNAFNVGLLLLTCPDIARLRDETHLSLDLSRTPPRVSLARDPALAPSIEPLPDFLLDMVHAGGLMPQLKRELSTKRSKPL